MTRTSPPELSIVAGDDKGADFENNAGDNDGDDWNEEHGDGKVEVTPYDEGPKEAGNSNVNINIHENMSQEQPIVVDDGEGDGGRHNDGDDHGYDGQVGQIIYSQDQST